ncbi:MAG: endonuclease/exonuclease/phosphatase family protein [Pseudomonas sp.]
MRSALRHRRVTLMLAILLSAVQTAAAQGQAGHAAGMSLVTLNLHHDRDDWPARREYIAHELATLRPDVIALQEVIEREGRVANQAAWLAQRLGYDYEFASVDAIDAPKRYGNALLTRRPVLARRQRLLRPIEDYRIAAQLRIDVDGQPVNVYVTHLNERSDGRGRSIRMRQVADLLRFVSDTAGDAPVVIAGDFNSAADAIDLEALRGGYGDSYGSVHRDTRTSTLNMDIYDKPARIDHVFFQQQRLLAREAKILFDQPDAHGHWASDHYGVWARLQFAPPSPRPMTGSPPATPRTSSAE